MSDEKPKQRLGRGLAALMGDLDQPIEKKPDSVSENVAQKGERVVPIDRIRANPNNPRKIFDDAALDDLTNSIRKHGIVQPILVRPVEGEDLAGAEYEIVAGERRWRAAQKAALHHVPIIVREIADRQALELAIIENVQRADLNGIEEAFGYQQLIDEYDYSQNDLAQVIGKSRSHVANTLRLLKLPKNVQDFVSDGLLSAGHARTLVNAPNAKSLAKQIVEQGLSVRQAEMLAQEPEQNGESAGVSQIQSTASKTTDIVALEKRIEDALGLKIDIRHGDKNKGEIRIKYKNVDQLDEVCRRLEDNF